VFGHDEEFVRLLKNQLVLAWIRYFIEELKNPTTGTSTGHQTGLGLLAQGVDV